MVHVVLPLFVTTARVNVVLSADCVLPILSVMSPALHAPLTGGFANFHHHNAPMAVAANSIATTIHTHCRLFGFVVFACITIVLTRLYTQVYTKSVRELSPSDKIKLWITTTSTPQHHTYLSPTQNLKTTSRF